MANAKISELPAASEVTSSDLIPIVDVSSSTTQKAMISQIAALVGSGSTGPAGPAGAQGSTGVGVQGATGVAGLPGASGAQGATGVQGLQGATGVAIGGLTGSGVDNQLVVWSGTSSVEGSSSLTFDGSKLVVPAGSVTGPSIGPSTAGAGISFPTLYATPTVALSVMGARRLAVDEYNIAYLGPDGLSSATNCTLRPSATAGTNVSGHNLLLESGEGTGNSDVSSVVIKTPAMTTSGAGLQTASPRLAVTNSAVTIYPATAGNANTLAHLAVPDASGTNQSGSSFRITAGLATGTGTGGDFEVYSSFQSASGSTVHTPVEMFSVSHNGSYTMEMFAGRGSTQTTNSNSDLAITTTNTGSASNIAGYNISIYPGNSRGNVAGGYVRFMTSPAGASSGTTINAQTEVARFAGSGFELSRGGIKFPAVASSSTDANNLDDYEEGTWTPSFTAAGCTFAYTGRYGHYTKIGRVVILEGQIILATSGNTLAAAQLFISGAPFTPGAAFRGGPGTATVQEKWASSGGAHCMITSSDSQIWLYSLGTTYTLINANALSPTLGSQVKFTVVYQTETAS